MNDIYTFDSIEHLLIEFGADKIYPSVRRQHFRDRHPDIYNDIMTKTSFLTNPSFPERLHCYVYNITSRPICKVCPNEVSYEYGIVAKYNTYCCGKCAMKDMPSKLGVDNTSQLASVKKKEKHKQRYKEKYDANGILLPIKIKNEIPAEIKNEWKIEDNDIPEYMQDKFLTLTKDEYNKTVDQVTYWMYNTYIKLIDPMEIRGFNFQLDHKVSKYFGFVNKIPPRIIGDFNNLEIIPRSNNASKQNKNSITVEELYEAYNNFYSINELPPSTILTLIPKPKKLKKVTKKKSEMNFAYNKGKNWFNNGISETIKFECPAGWVPGRL